MPNILIVDHLLNVRPLLIVGHLLNEIKCFRSCCARISSFTPPPPPPQVTIWSNVRESCCFLSQLIFSILAGDGDSSRENWFEPFTQRGPSDQLVRVFQFVRVYPVADLKSLSRLWSQVAPTPTPPPPPRPTPPHPCLRVKWTRSEGSWVGNLKLR